MSIKNLFLILYRKMYINFFYVQIISGEESMKKIIFIVVSLFLLSGCNEINNTPTKQVETFLNKYQTLDADVIKDLDKVISEEVVFDSTSREDYREVIKEQYKNLTYKIKDETMEGDEATVTVEITVTDYRKILNETEKYKIEHITEFQDENGEYNAIKYSNYVIKELKKAKDKVSYTLDLKLIKIDEKWQLEPIDDITEDKILGIYQY